MTEKRISLDDLLDKLLELSETNFNDPNFEPSPVDSGCLKLAHMLFDIDNQKLCEILVDKAQEQTKLNNEEHELIYGNIDQNGDDIIKSASR